MTTNSIKFNQVVPQIGDFVQITSCDWYVWTGKIWREMTLKEQLEIS